MEVFQLDEFHFGPYDAVKWSEDNHMAVCGKDKVIILTLPFQPLSGSTPQRTVINMSCTSIRWSKHKIGGYHQLALLDTNGNLHTYRPNMNPAWNEWLCVKDKLFTNVIDFDWTGDSSTMSFVYSRGDEVWRDEELVSKRPGNLAKIVRSLADGKILIGWTDGSVQIHDDKSDCQTVREDRVWHYGPAVDDKCFAKLDLIINGTREIKVDHMVTGLSRNHAALYDGSFVELGTANAVRRKDLDCIYGMDEIDGFVAIGGIIKGKSCLMILNVDPTVDIDEVTMQSSLRDRWIHAQKHPITLNANTNSMVHHPDALKCCYCKFEFVLPEGSIFVPNPACPKCGAPSYQLYAQITKP